MDVTVSHWTISIVDDADNATLDQLRELFREYHAWLGEVVCSVRLAEEIADLPGPYAAPTGRLWIARDAQGVPVGCIGVRPHHDDQCEIKRLYVRDAARGTGLGSELVALAIAAARELGYATALVTTLPAMMPRAAGMYERLGFTRTEPFVDHSHVDEGVEMLYLRLELHA